MVMPIFWAIVVFGLLIFFHELGHFLISKFVGVKVLRFSLGFGPKLVGKRIGDTEYIISLVPLGGYVKPLGEEPGEEIKEEDKPKAFNYQSVWKRMMIILAGPVFNLLLAYVIFVIFLSAKLPIAIPQLSNLRATVEEVMEDSPAMKAGLKKGDTIVSIDGKTIKGWNEMAEIFSKNPGKELRLKVRRGDRLVDIRVIPKPTKIKDEYGREIMIGRIGISKKLNFKVIQSVKIFQVPLKGLEAVTGWCILTLEIVKKLLTGAVSMKQIGGPILIIDSAAKAASAGMFAYFNLIAIISINLAILNLFPIPVLDGGHLLFLSIEAVRRRPLSETVMGVLTKVGLAILMFLIAFVFYNDFVRIVIPWLNKTLQPLMK